MPTYGWILDSDIDRYNASKHDSDDGWPTPQPTPPKPPTVSCMVPGCRSVFVTRDALQGHLFEVHRDVACFFELDEQVALDGAMLVERLPVRARVVAQGMPEISVRWRTIVPAQDGWSVFPERKRDGEWWVVDCIAALRTVNARRLEIEVQWGTLVRSFQIFLQDAPPLLEHWVEQIDASIVSAQRKQVQAFERGRHWAMSAQSDWQSAPRFEKRYGDGLFEYLIGHDLASRAQQYDRRAYHRFERAWQLLLPFEPLPLAAYARGLAALRLGWFKALRGTGVARLKKADRFFNGTPACGNSADGDSLDTGTPSATVAMPIDTFHKHYLEAIDALSDGDFETASNQVRALHAEPRLRGNQVNLDKLSLLEARLARATGREAEMREFYRQLLDHRHFGHEATEHQ